ncbi:MAG: hypothetical protein J7D61_11060 [Marichromatium sp.]|nr:hypothetical protein [Marichromatium sp.]
MASLGALTRAVKAHHTIRFNAALPIGIEVLESVGYRRYHLRVGHKEMTTRSVKELKPGERYWGNFSESKDGILTISHLRKKPKIMQHDEGFILLDSFDFLEMFVASKTPSLVFKQWILEALYETEEKALFQTLSSMLLALHEGIVHLPLQVANRQILLQWKENQRLNDSWIHFYIAYENLGALGGMVSSHHLALEALFERTAHFLSRHDNTLPLALSINTNDALLPLWEGESALLDIKG